jgi:hypothetical protein
MYGWGGGAEWHVLLEKKRKETRKMTNEGARSRSKYDPCAHMSAYTISMKERFI